MMTPRERVEAILLGREADRVPFTIYECMLPQCEAERRLRNEGLCIVQRLINVFNTVSPDVKETATHYVENGASKIRTDIETPCGNLFTVTVNVALDAPSKETPWAEQRLFKSPEDYKAIEFMIRNRQFTANYGPLLKAREQAGDDVSFRTGIAYEPMQEIITGIMGIETFSYELAANRDEILKLYDALVEERRRIYPIVAQSPAMCANYGGNVIPEMIGPERFEKYYLPHYEECAEIMHKHGKLLGCHLDGNNKLIAELVAKTSLDYIEAFTPAPDTNMTMKEALEVWPDKVVWIHFPSSVHMQSPEDIEQTMLDILDQAKPGNRLIVGITEDVPLDHWQKSHLIISRTLIEHGKLPLN